MFTGLVEALGTVEAITVNNGISQFRIGFEASEPWDAKYGDSIAVNGCCLTVTQILPKAYTFDVSRETLSKTNLDKLEVGHKVNLERAMAVGERLGGHLVSGHVDGLGSLSSLDPREDGWLVQVKLDQALSRYVIPKGSICLDGVSLTVNQLDDYEDYSLLQLMLIPATVRDTTFSQLPIGWSLNVEVDMLAKFMERLTKFGPKE